MLEPTLSKLDPKGVERNFPVCEAVRRVSVPINFKETTMQNAIRTGRLVGVMLLLQLAGLMIGFILLDALRTADFLSNAASIRSGMLVLMANGLLTIGISISAWPVFRRYSEPMAMWLIVLSVIMFLLQVVDNVHIMSMLSLQQQFTESGGPADLYNALAASVRTTRRWAHFFELMAIDFWLVMFYAILLRFGLVSRIIAGLGLIMVLLQFISVPLSGFLGYGINTNFGVPMAVGLLATAVWLIWKGFGVKGHTREP